jgi:hypothetical protein
MKALHIYTSVLPSGGLPDAQAIAQKIKDAVCSHAGKDICITIQRKRQTRSSNQNRFFHGAFLPSMTDMHNEFGTFDFEVDEEFVKEWMKQQDYWPKIEGVPVPSSRMTTTQIEAAMEGARIRYASVWPLPYPNEEELAAWGRLITKESVCLSYQKN